MHARATKDMTILSFAWGHLAAFQENMRLICQQQISCLCLAVLDGWARSKSFKSFIVEVVYVKVHVEVLNQAGGYISVAVVLGGHRSQPP